MSELLSGLSPIKSEHLITWPSAIVHTHTLNVSTGQNNPDLFTSQFYIDRLTLIRMPPPFSTNTYLFSLPLVLCWNEARYKLHKWNDLLYFKKKKKRFLSDLNVFPCDESQPPLIKPAPAAASHPYCRCHWGHTQHCPACMDCSVCGDLALVLLPNLCFSVLKVLRVS